MTGEARVRVAAPAEHVFAMVSDITRMGQWSPETVKAFWLGGGGGGAVGARFVGVNRQGPAVWFTVPKVTALEPGRLFEFATHNTVWRYELTPVDGGTEVVESFRTTSVPRVAAWYFERTDRERVLVRGVEKTLARIKAAAEASAS